MLRYLEGLSGHQRELSKQKAQQMVEQYGEEGQHCLSETRLCPFLSEGKGEGLYCQQG